MINRSDDLPHSPPARVANLVLPTTWYHYTLVNNVWLSCKYELAKCQVISKIAIFRLNRALLYPKAQPSFKHGGWSLECSRHFLSKRGIFTLSHTSARLQYPRYVGNLKKPIQTHSYSECMNDTWNELEFDDLISAHSSQLQGLCLNLNKPCIRSNIYWTEFLPKTSCYCNC